MTEPEAPPALEAMEPPAARPPATPVPPAAPTPRATSAAPKGNRNPLRWLGELFWRGRAIAAVLADATLVPPRARELHRRAKLTAEAARRALEPAGPFANGPGDAIACELYREAIYWALAALASVRSEQPAHLDGDFQKLWRAADPSVLLRAAGDTDTFASIGEALIGRSFADYPDLPVDDQRVLAFSLRRFTDALLALVDGPQARLDRLKLQRFTRIGIVILLFAVSVPLLSLARELSERRRDLAKGRPWQASSHLMGGCKSPEQSCTDSPGYFFHTIEETNPSITFDLGKARTISSVRAVNRTDCCPERATPLVIEVSDDKQRWKVVASRSQTFRNWQATFKPTSARYVRFRATRKTWLHLSEVRILE